MKWKVRHKKEGWTGTAEAISTYESGAVFAHGHAESDIHDNAGRAARQMVAMSKILPWET